MKPRNLIGLVPATLLINLLTTPASASDCSVAFVCEVVNYQRMLLDGRLQKLPSEPFGFRLEDNQLIPQRDGSPLGDGTLNFKIHSLLSCDVNSRLLPDTFTKNVQFEGDNGLYTFEYINGQMLISNHKHHDFFEVVAAQCREL